MTKAKFHKIIDRTMSKGPKTVTNLAEFFAASPLRGSGLKVPRRKELAETSAEPRSSRRNARLR
jgi:hypothetical protein